MHLITQFNTQLFILSITGPTFFVTAAGKPLHKNIFYLATYAI